MFNHTKKLQYESRPDRPDPVYAKQLQEVLGGQWGEISVAMSYLFQGWNCRGPTKYPQELEFSKVSYKFLDFSEGEASKDGCWASGPSPDGKGTFTYEPPTTYGPAAELGPADPRLWGTPKSRT